MRGEGDPTVRFLPHGQATRLIEELPLHLAEMARFALAVGENLLGRHRMFDTGDALDMSAPGPASTLGYIRTSPYLTEPRHLIANPIHPRLHNPT